ncbi:MAG: hypothetical protein M4579_003987 [Chaenotheca gracillima]|nr:MAG: hypothetical protein M4579_003987 [Chaenotheca gracillima]
MMGDPQRASLADSSTSASEPPVERTSKAASKKISTACSSCKKRKVKCSGPPSPCDACVSHDRECTFNEESDARRKVAYKRKVEESELYQNALQDLVEALRSTNEPEFGQLLDLIRSNASMEDILSSVDDVIKQRRGQSESSRILTAGLEETRKNLASAQGPQSKAPRNTMDVRFLCDTPPIMVPAKPWTDVTDDDQFVSHLVSLYFTWCHPFFHFIDREPFLASMRRGDVDTQYCSPFLVNMMLAEACPFSDYPEAYATPGELSSLGEHFHSEAMKLWEAEGGKASLTNAQGLALMFMRASESGEDRVGYLSLQKSIQMCHDLGLHRPAPASQQSPTQGPRVLERAREVAIWGIYNMDSMMKLTLLKPTKFTTPQVKKPYSDLELEKDPDGVVTWAPYPESSQEESGPARLRETFITQCELAEISSDICNKLFIEEDPLEDEDLWVAIQSFEERLLKQHEAMSRRFDKTPGPVFDYILAQLHYHCIVITLFGINSASSDQPSDGRISAAEEQRISSAREVARLTTTYREHYGVDRVPALILQSTSIALFALLPDLNAPESHRAFNDLAIAAIAASHRWIVAKGMLRLIQLTAGQMHIDFSPETQHLLDELEVHEWRRHGNIVHETSMSDAGSEATTYTEQPQSAASDEDPARSLAQTSPRSREGSKADLSPEALRVEACTSRLLHAYQLHLHGQSMVGSESPDGKETPFERRGVSFMDWKHGLERVVMHGVSVSANPQRGGS